MEETELRVGVEVHKADCVLRRSLSNRVKAAGIDEVTLMHGWFIRYLYEHRVEDVFQRDLEQHFAIGRSTITSTIQLMEKKGYICRESVAQDARLKKVLLTEKGIRTHEEMTRIVEQVDNNILSGISKEELSVFFRVIRKIQENAGKERQNDSDIIA